MPAWHPHFDVWALIFVLGFGYAYAERRLRPVLAPASTPASARQWMQWFGGLASIYLVSDWPLHDIGETALFSIHMVEHIVIALVAAPLLLMGIPRWMADATLGNRRVAMVLKPLAKAVPAFFLFNLTLAGLHWPVIVEGMVTNSLVHFAVHAALFGSALLMWLPVLSPTPAIPKLSPPIRMLYLLMNSILPTVPASFLTFGREPLYPVYGDAALRYGLTAVEDQTISGIIMKLGGGAIIWTVIAVLWFRWYAEERRFEAIERELADR